MNYFYELLENYSNLKKRKLKLLEQTGNEIQGNTPEQRVQNIISRTTPNYTNKNPLILYLGNRKFICSRKVKNNKVTNEVTVTYNGRPYNLTNNPQPIYPHLKSSEESAGPGRGQSKEKSPEGATAEAGIATTEQPGKAKPLVSGPKLTYDFLDGPEFMPKNKYDEVVSKICKNDKQLCKALKGNHKRLLNTGNSGDLARIISQSRYITVSCDPSEALCKPQKNDQDTTKVKKTVSKTLKNLFEILSKENLTPQDISYIKQSVSISKVGQIIIKDPITGEGMLFHEDSKFITSLLNGMISLHKDPETEKPIEIESNHRNFLRSGNGIGGRGALVRGFFFEDLRNAAILSTRCAKIPESSPESSRCRKKISNLFERWVQNQDKLTEAFQDLMNQYNSEGGSLAIDLENETDMFLIQTVINTFGNGDIKNAEEAMRKFSNVMTRMAYLGVTLRNPLHVIPAKYTTGLSRKADMSEIYSTREAALAALNRMGLTGPEAEKMVVERSSEDLSCEGNDCDKLKVLYTVGDSLKFSNDAESIDLGQASQSNITAAIDGTYCGKVVKDSPRCREDVKKQLKMIKDAGVTENDLTLVNSELKRYQEEFKKMASIPKEVEYFTQKGTVRVLQSLKAREQFLKTTLDHFRSSDLFNGLTENIKNEIEREISNLVRGSETQDWERVCSNIASVIQKRRIQSLIDAKNEDGSPDLVKRRQGLGFIVALGLFSGGAADNSMLSVVDAADKSMYVGSQNSFLQSMVDSIQNEQNIANAKVEVKDGKFLLNGIEISFNGERADCYIPESILRERSTKILSLKQGGDLVKGSQ